MTILKANSYNGKRVLSSASNFEGRELCNVYGSYSYAKAHAYAYCRQRCFEEDGKNFRITSHNTFGFSVAWDVDGGTRVETPKNSYFVMD